MCSRAPTHPQVSGAYVILVTGGTGFVGREVTRVLVGGGHAVRVLSRRPRSIAEPQISFFHGDITSLSDLRIAMQGCRQVFHCAGEKLDAGQMARVNVAATRTLFELAA